MDLAPLRFLVIVVAHLDGGQALQHPPSQPLVLATDYEPHLLSRFVEETHLIAALDAGAATAAPLHRRLVAVLDNGLSLCECAQSGLFAFLQCEEIALGEF